MTTISTYRRPNGPTFEAHAAGCRHRRTGLRHDFDYEAETKWGVVAWYYGPEAGDFESWETDPSVYFHDFHFSPCLDELPLGDPSEH